MLNDNLHFDIELTQLLELGDNRIVARFIISADNIPDGKLSIEIIPAANGERITDSIALSRWHHVNARYYRLYSVFIPATLKDFDARVEAAHGNTRASVHIDSQTYTQMIDARNLLMVNPGIDGVYNSWSKAHEATSKQLKKQQAHRFPSEPFFSIVVPVYNTPKSFLKDLVSSICRQSYEKWELVFVDASPDNASLTSAISSMQANEGRIKVIKLEKNLGIAGNTNRGIVAATGDYVCFCDHDDVLAPDALYEYAKAINDNADADVLYCDEDSFNSDLGHVFHPRFKPDFNIDLLYSHCYILHMLTIKTTLLNQLDLASDEASGAQDYDLMLKAYEKDARFIHISKVLYHWRQHEGSTNGGVTTSKPYVEQAGAWVVESHLHRRGLRARVELTDISCVYRTVYEIEDSARSSRSAVYAITDGAAFCPQVLGALLKSCNDVIIALSENIDVRDLGDLSKATVIICNDYDASALFNEGIGFAKFDSVILVSDSVAHIEGDAIDVATSYFQRRDIGLVGFKGFSLDGLIAHSGVCVRDHGALALFNQDFSDSMGGGYMGTAECTCDFSAVASGCVATRKSLFEKVGGLQRGLSYDLALVDYSFKVRREGLLVLQTPYAHYVTSDLGVQDKATILAANCMGETRADTDCVLVEPLAITEFRKRWEKELGSRDPLVNENISQSAAYFHIDDRECENDRIGLAFKIAKCKASHLFG